LPGGPFQEGIGTVHSEWELDGSAWPFAGSQTECRSVVGDGYGKEDEIQCSTRER
jgi:hypothetical protein